MRLADLNASTPITDDLVGWLEKVNGAPLSSEALDNIHRLQTDTAPESGVSMTIPGVPAPGNGYLNWPNRWKQSIGGGSYAVECGYLNSVLFFEAGQSTSPGSYSFGLVTFYATLNFQLWWGLVADGWCPAGGQTWAYIDWVTTL